MYNLKNKNVVLTGALGLLGKKISETLANCGCNVIMMDLKGEKFLKEINNYNLIKSHLFYYKCNIRNKNDIIKNYNKIIKKFKKVDVLINAAAVTDAVENKPKAKNSMFENYSLKDWNNSLEGNLTSLFLCCQIFGKIMTKLKKGSIINIASTYGVVAPDQKIYLNKDKKNTFYKNPAYPTTKGAVISFSKYLASYWGKHSIRVNSVSPGGIENKQAKHFVQNYSNKTLLGRMAKTEDMVGIIKLLCSDESSYITGTNIIVDGGWTAI